MATITVNDNTINPEAPAYVSQDAKGYNFIYIQGCHDLTMEQKQQLAAMSVEIQEYVSEHTYLCRYTPDDLGPLQALDYVRTANIYHPDLKGTISLKDMIQRETDRTEYEVDLILHTEANMNSTALAPHVADTAGVDVNELKILSNKIRLTVHQDRLSDLAALDSVNRIEKVRPNTLYNDQARGTLQAEALFTSTGYQGADQITCVADTGFDQGTSTNVHPAFVGRIEKLATVWDTGAFKDPHGHGTHVCGSVCGSGTYTNPVEGKSIGVKGTAPAAKLMVQSLLKYFDANKRWEFWTPDDVGTLFPGPYDLKIRIHNNSWGTTWDEHVGQLGYEADATAIDNFVSNHQDFVVLIAAGNDATKNNHGASQIGTNGAAKNCITVGATGTTRPNDGFSYKANVPAKSRTTDTAIFSSRGPTKPTSDSQGREIPGRIKPDVVAPGVVILSAASRSVAPNAAVRTEYGPNNDNDWLFMSGTSMATPLVAGCVALLREALYKHGKTKPSAALVKALLINGAVNYSSQNGLGFDGEQGFGRVDIDRSVAMIKQSTFVEGGSKLEATTHDVHALRFTTDTERRWESPPIPVPSGRYRLVVTLAYPDAPAALLQNDVNLIVRAGQVERHGNMGSGTDFDHISKLPCLVSGTSADRTADNVEKIIWDNMPPTSVTIVVQAHAFTKPDSEQAFAVACYIQALASL